MAYQAKRKKLYQEEFQLVDENGDVVETLHVELDPDMVAKSLSQKHAELLRIMKQWESAKNVPAEILECAGKTVKEILEIVFGGEGARKIIGFYDEKTIEMCAEVMPFVFQHALPAVRKMAQENRAAIASGYNRKQRRLLFRKK